MLVRHMSAHLNTKAALAERTVQTHAKTRERNRRNEKAKTIAGVSAHGMYCAEYACVDGDGRCGKADSAKTDVGCF